MSGYPEPKKDYDSIPEDAKATFHDAQTRIKAYALNTYFEERKRKEEELVKQGIAIICPVNQDVCEYDDCQTTCNEEGCTHFKQCWDTTTQRPTN